MLDALVAERVMDNVQPRELDNRHFSFSRWLTYWGVPNYSTDLAQAIQVAEKLRENGWLVVMKWMPAEFYFTFGGGMVSEYDAPQPPPTQALKGKTIVELEWMRRYEKFHLMIPPLVSADTPALAICRAAIAAVDALEEVMGHRQSGGR